VTLLRLHGVCKRFGPATVLSSLNLAVERGEIYGLLGPNGSGKSTALNILCGLLAPDAGSVKWADAHPEREAGRAAASRIGLCAQQPALYRDLRPAENLEFHARIQGLPSPRRARRVAEVMDLFGLQAHAGRTAAELSGGWQQRLHMACAVVHEPDLLILDEPTSAVDLEARHALWALIVSLQAGGMTILMTTHHLDEAERLCGRIGILQEGRLVAEGSLATLRARVPAQAIALLRGDDEAALRQRAQVLGWPTRTYAGQLACLLPQPATLGDVVRAFEGLALRSATVQPVGLEHAYLEVLQAPSGRPDRG
jgi:ABC-2 type transport system ATP-binding protein